MFINLIGFVAAICTTVSFVPQALKTILTKDTKGISLGMYIMFVIGVILWLAYGIFIRDFPLIIANCITLMLSMTILIYKLRYR
ncbi:MAG: SemiSWEET transporter [Spirochaetaceae bacterium]